MPIDIEFRGQDASRLRAKRIDASGLTTAQRAALDASVSDACFFSSKVSDAKLLEKMRDYIADAAEGKRFHNRNDFIRTMKEAMGAEKDKARDSHGSLTDITSSRRLGLIYDFQRERMSAEIFLAQADDPDHRFIYPALELVRKERREVPRDWIARWEEAGGELRQGRMVALRDDPIWSKISRFGSPVPPFDFNSGMGLEEIDIEEAQELGLQTPEYEGNDESGEEEDDELNLDDLPDEIEFEIDVPAPELPQAESMEASVEKILETTPQEQREIYRTALSGADETCREAAVKAAETGNFGGFEELPKGQSEQAWFQPADKRICLGSEHLENEQTIRHEYFHFVDHTVGGGAYHTATPEFEAQRKKEASQAAKGVKLRKSDAEAFAKKAHLWTKAKFDEEADKMLSKFGISASEVEVFFRECGADGDEDIAMRFRTLGVDELGRKNGAAWWFAKCLERRDIDAAARCFFTPQSYSRKELSKSVMRSLSDYVGTLTRNKQLGQSGIIGYGHSDAYYRQRRLWNGGNGGNSELFANFGAISGAAGTEGKIAAAMARAASPELWQNLTDALKMFIGT